MLNCYYCFNCGDQINSPYIYRGKIYCFSCFKQFEAQIEEEFLQELGKDEDED